MLDLIWKNNLLLKNVLEATSMGFLKLSTAVMS